MEKLSDYLTNNWKDLAIVWNESENLLTLDRNYKNWSCFFINKIILSCFKDSKIINKRIILNLKNYESLDFLEKGFIYEFCLFGHTFNLIYFNDEDIYYVDYYNETNRENLFRFEPIKKETIHELILAYFNHDTKFIKEFHLGDDEYESSLAKEEEIIITLASTNFEFDAKNNIDEIMNLLLEFPFCWHDVFYNLNNFDFNYEKYKHMKIKDVECVLSSLDIINENTIKCYNNVFTSLKNINAYFNNVNESLNSNLDFLLDELKILFTNDNTLRNMTLFEVKKDVKCLFYSDL